MEQPAEGDTSTPANHLCHHFRFCCSPDRRNYQCCCWSSRREHPPRLPALAAVAGHCARTARWLLLLLVVMLLLLVEQPAVGDASTPADHLCHHFRFRTSSPHRQNWCRWSSRREHPPHLPMLAAVAGHCAHSLLPCPPHRRTLAAAALQNVVAPGDGHANAIELHVCCVLRHHPRRQRRQRRRLLHIEQRYRPWPPSWPKQSGLVSGVIEQ